VRFFQGGETLFPILAASVSHGDGTRGEMGLHINELLVIGTIMIISKRGSKCDKFPIGFREGVGSTGIFFSSEK
jgi:hypothetical protein